MKKNFLKLIAGFAMLMTVTNANLTCMFWVNQPKLPEKAKLLRKF